jgi:hypothetical protein
MVKILYTIAYEYAEDQELYLCDIFPDLEISLTTDIKNAILYTNEDRTIQIAKLLEQLHGKPYTLFITKEIYPADLTDEEDNDDLYN